MLVDIMPLQYLLNQAWSWFAGPGINIIIIIVLAMLVPRAGRFAERMITREVSANQDEDESKSTLAIWGVGIYVVQIIAYFLLIVAFLQQVGFSLAGAAIPATVVSAAVGFGAQSIIADFLAGFFILSEKQYGVGDWVKFAGNGVEVEGTVIAITMRATKIRTISQETVIIPNSTARISINASNFWSRAVVVIPVPLLGSQNARDAAERSERAARRALAHENVAAELIGELDVHPAVAVNPPSTVGMPWTVDMRFMIQTTAGNHWFVERAIRMAILEEFWDEYGSATTASGQVLDHVATAELTSESPTVLFDELDTASQETTGDTGNTIEDIAEEDPESQDYGESDATEDLVAESDPEDKKPLHRFWASLKEMRSSTLWLIIVLVVLIVLKPLFFSTENEEGDRVAGVLAPRPISTAEETEEPEQPEPTAPLTQEYEPQPQQTTPPPGNQPQNSPTQQPQQPTPNNPQQPQQQQQQQPEDTQPSISEQPQVNPGAPVN